MTDPLLGTTHGDEAAARQLRRALQVLADHHARDPLGAEIQKALAGQISMRELASQPEFAALTREGMEQYARERAAMTPQERVVADREAAELARWAEGDSAG